MDFNPVNLVNLVQFSCSKNKVLIYPEAPQIVDTDSIWIATDRYERIWPGSFRAGEQLRFSFERRCLFPKFQRDRNSVSRNQQMKFTIMLKL